MYNHNRLLYCDYVNKVTIGGGEIDIFGLSLDYTLYVLTHNC